MATPIVCNGYSTLTVSLAVPDVLFSACIFDMTQGATRNLAFTVAETGGVNQMNVTFQVSNDLLTWFNVVPLAINQDGTGVSFSDGVFTVNAGSAVFCTNIVGTQYTARYGQLLIQNTSTGDEAATTINAFIY